ncbi:helix-turn-helix transcriptional regulator [Nocardia salmonicida]|uniref:helix-turn-helix transcriptional regulator n=1 Tax=Nocardia salmonicida TaxID=53431 RepID=UPI0007A49341|nr:helix-turn-helix transcriptional regulator [Nocardia salmonicida]
MSADYYIRLEQGRDRHPSDQIVAALARVFSLDDDGAAHLRELARPAPRRTRAARRPERVTPSQLRLMRTWSDTPALVLGRHMEVLAATPLAVAQYFPDWPKIAAETAAGLRVSAGTDLADPRLTELVGELSLKSEDFRRLSAKHEVRAKTAGQKRFTHPLVGELALSYETFTVNGAPGQTLVVYHAEPGSDAEQSLVLLAGLSVDSAPGHSSVTTG